MRHLPLRSARDADTYACAAGRQERGLPGPVSTDRLDLSQIGDAPSLGLLAEAVESETEGILRLWLADARKIVAEHRGRVRGLTDNRLDSEGRHVLRCLSPRLWCSNLDPQTDVERLGLTILGHETPEGATPDTWLVTGFRLHYALAKSVWVSARRALPADLTARQGESLRVALLEAMRQILGDSPWSFVVRLEGSLRQERHTRETVFQRLLLDQEEDRRRAAREVHDQMSQTLAAAAFRTETAMRVVGGDPGQAAAELREVARLIQHALDRGRDIIFDLRPVALDRYGLLGALEAYAAKVGAQTGRRPMVRATGDFRMLSQDKQVTLFRTACEAIQNAVRHSGASTVEVDLSIAGGQVVVGVTDDGSGFEPARFLEGTPDRARCGLRCMSHQAAMLGGSMTIHSAPGQGSQVVISVPLGIMSNDEI